VSVGYKFFTPFPDVNSKKFLRLRQSSELLPELDSFVFLLQFKLVFAGVIPQATEGFWSCKRNAGLFFSQNVGFLISLNSSVSWNPEHGDFIKK